MSPPICEASSFGGFCLAIVNLLDDRSIFLSLLYRIKSQKWSVQCVLANHTQKSSARFKTQINVANTKTSEKKLFGYVIIRICLQHTTLDLHMLRRALDVPFLSLLGSYVDWTSNRPSLRKCSISNSDYFVAGDSLGLFSTRLRLCHRYVKNWNMIYNILFILYYNRFSNTNSTLGNKSSILLNERIRCDFNVVYLHVSNLFIKQLKR